MTSVHIEPITIDAWGLTDRGKMRAENEDHFIVAEIHKSVEVLSGSLSSEAVNQRIGKTGAQLLVVADGVGGGPRGDFASERSTTAVLTYAAKTAGCFHGLDVDHEHSLLMALEDTVHEVHSQLLKDSPLRDVAADPEQRSGAAHRVPPPSAPSGIAILRGRAGSSR